MRYPGDVRTTVDIDADVAAEIARLRHEHGIGLSAAVNLLARRGMTATNSPRAPYELKPSQLGVRINVDNIGDVLDLLDDA